MKKSVLLMMSALLYLTVSAQVRHLYTSDQLTSNLITAICQDHVGHIWVGTEFGLNKYDGYRFTNYMHEAEKPNSINSNNVVSLFVDKEGSLWVGTGKGLARYNEANDDFERINLNTKALARVNGIIQPDPDHLLIGTAGYGLVRLDIHTLNTEDLSAYAKDDSDYFSNIIIDDQGNFWKAGSSSTVTYRLNDQSHTTGTYDIPYGLVTCFVKYEGGLLMVCREGLVFYRDGRFFTDFIDTSILGQESVQFRSALCDKAGNLYIGTMGQGLCWVPRGSHQLQHYEIASAAFDLNTSNVWALYEDNQDNLWIGLLNRGLLLVPQRDPLFSTWTFSGQNVGVGGSVTTICQGDDGMTWCAVQNNGVYGFDRNGRVVAHPKSPSDTYSVFRDHKGDYWVGTGSGLYAYQPLTGNYKKEFDFPSNYINAMVDDNAGHLFVSTYSRGFCSYDLKTKELRNFTMQQTDSLRGRLHNNWVMSLLIDSRGMLWIGTSSNLCCYDPKRDTFRPFGWEVLLEGKTVNTIYEDRSHHILIGTDIGLYAYNPQTREAEPYPGEGLLANKVINGIYEDHFGDLWCSTTQGILQYQHRQQRVVAYVNSNGLASHEYVRNTCIDTDDRRVYFAVSDGVTSFQPAALREIRQEPGSVHLTGLYIGGTAVNCKTLSDGEAVITEPLTESHHFSFSYLDNTFSMEFSLLSTDAENIVYEYRMNGAQEWVSTGAGNNVISFHHLQPDSYVMEVRACDGGVYTEPQTYHIVVRPPWYKSGWAYIVYILVAFTIAALAVWLYVRRRNQELNEEKMKFLINATHDIRSPLTLIMSPLSKLLKRSDLDADVREDLTVIDRSARRIQNLVNQILDIRKIDKRQMPLQCQETDMVQFVGRVLKTYEYFAHERGITLKYTPTVDRLNVWFDRTAIDKVIDNLLSNAFKYTYDGGEIEVRVSQGERRTAMLQVLDTGMGIKGDLSKIFDRFYQGSTSRSLHIEGTGIGLHLCKMIISMHHGTISAQNREGQQGSIFTVSLPLGNAHFAMEEMMQRDTTERVARQKVKTNIRVMVVDDDVEIGNYIKEELGGYYHITTVTSGREALRLLIAATQERQYDLVVSDVMMPEMDGFTMLRLIKTNMNINHIPVVMLTSKSDVANRLEGLEKGADAFLAKPFNMDELHVIINNLISKNLRLKGKYSGTQQQKDKVEEKKVKGNDEILMERIMKVINEHLSDSDFNVDMLTRDVGISRAQLHRKMKEMTGLPISEFVRNIRLEQAVRLLKEQKINVTQVAYTVGFSNLAHFSTVFRKQFGVSPSEYVEQVNHSKK